MASFSQRTSFTTVRFHRVPQKCLPACYSFFLASNKSSINIHLKVINEEKLRWGDKVTGNQGMLTGSRGVFNQIRLEILAEGSVLFTPPPGVRKQAWCDFFFFFFSALKCQEEDMEKWVVIHPRKEGLGGRWEQSHCRGWDGATEEWRQICLKPEQGLWSMSCKVSEWGDYTYSQVTLLRFFSFLFLKLEGNINNLREFTKDLQTNKS